MSLDNRSRAQWREVYERAMDDLRHERKRANLAHGRLAVVRAYVDDPGNWSTLDGRRRTLLELIDGTACRAVDCQETMPCHAHGGDWPWVAS